MSLAIDHLVLRLPASGLGPGPALTPAEARELAEAVARRLAGWDGGSSGSAAVPRRVAALDLSLRIEGRRPIQGGSRIEELADEIADRLCRSLHAY